MNVLNKVAADLVADDRVDKVTCYSDMVIVVCYDRTDRVAVEASMNRHPSVNVGYRGLNLKVEAI